MGSARDPAFIGDWLALGCTVISVEDRPAPEYPFPADPEDCYAGLLWTFANASELGIDPDRIAIAEAFAGAGCAPAWH